MVWTAAYFVHKSVLWQGYRDHVFAESGHRFPGHIAYAIKQIELWTEMARNADSVFVKAYPEYYSHNR